MTVVAMQSGTSDYLIGVLAAFLPDPKTAGEERER